ncbi:hypothetical protein ACSYDW_08735 [Paeniglutamicibacter sp. R2-26]|uniref:hypothetical protein n=1 Tax=Paeniglutamicibacter sp. R2-26 TaxID=3144417 RepID=UPI003EE687DC
MQNVVERPKSNIRATKFAVVALWLVAGGALISNLGQMITIITGRFLFTFGDIDPRLPLSTLPQLLQAEVRDGGAGYLVDAPLWLRLLCASPLAAHMATVLLAAFLITGIIQRIAAGQPFNASVLHNWKWLSAVLIVGGTIQGALDAMAGRSIYTLAGDSDVAGQFPLGADYMAIGVDLPQWPILMMLLGVIAAALAIAFRSGARLESEVDGVV